MTPVEMLRGMMLIRAFEDALARRRDHGFQLLSSGEEAVAVGLASALEEGDQLLTGGRSIGPALARGVAPERLMAELLAARGDEPGARGAWPPVGSGGRFFWRACRGGWEYQHRRRGRAGAADGP